MDLITIFTLVAVGAAAFSATMSWRAVKEMKRDRIERSQPTVIFDVDADPKGAYWCLLENVGPGIAYDVRISFDPVPNDYKGNPLSEWAWVAKSIPVFPPTKNKRQIFWSSQQYFNS